MNEPRRLHPVAALINFLKTVRELILPLGLFILFGGNEEGEFISLRFIVLAVTLLGALATGILLWYRYTYWVDEGELRVEYGIFVRKKRYIPLERIQTIDISAGIIQRLFRLVTLRVETAGGGQEAEAVFTAVTKEEAERIKAALLDDGMALFQKKEEVLEQYEATAPRLFIAASTSGSIGVVLSAIGAFISQFDEFIPYKSLFNKVESYTDFNVIIISILGLFAILLVWLASILMMVIRYGRFTVVKQGNDLVISRGLLEKRQFTIPITRIQAIRIAENPIRQLLGYAAVYVESAGGAAGKESNYSTILFPLVKRTELNELLQQFTCRYVVPASFTPLPSRSLRRYIFRAIFPMLILVVPAIYFFRPWGYLSLLFLIIFTFIGYVSFKDAGVCVIDNRRMVLRYRLVNKTTVLLEKNKIQALAGSQSVFQRKKRLANVQATIQSSSLHSKVFRVMDVDEAEVTSIQSWYRAR